MEQERERKKGMDFVETHKEVVSLANQFITDWLDSLQGRFEGELYKFLFENLPREDVIRVLEVVGEEGFIEACWEEFLDALREL